LVIGPGFRDRPNYFIQLNSIHPDIKRTLVSMSERTGMTVSQVADEVLYTGLLEMQELDAQG
jgi:hypothetical protein